MAESSSSSSGEVSATGDAAVDVVRLANRIHKRLAGPPHLALPVAEHRRACDAMQKLRDAMLGTVPEWERHRLAPAPREVLLALSCAGVAVTRRIAFAHEGDSPTDLKRTAGLLLMLLVMATGDTTVPEAVRGTPDADGYDADGELRGEEARGFTQEVNDFQSGTVERTLDNAARSTRSSDWQFPNPKPSDICDSVVWLLNHHSINTSMEELEKWAPLFFRNSAAAAARGLLDSAGTGDFVAMSSAPVLNETQHREERLLAVVSAAESEAGQTVRALHSEPCFFHPSPPLLPLSSPHALLSAAASVSPHSACAICS